MRINYEFFIFCANSLWIHHLLTWSLYRSIIAFKNSLLIHYLLCEFTLNALSFSYLNHKVTIFFANSWFIIVSREFTINSPSFFANPLWVHHFLREFSLNSSFFVNNIKIHYLLVHYEFTIYFTNLFLHYLLPEFTFFRYYCFHEFAINSLSFANSLWIQYLSRIYYEFTIVLANKPYIHYLLWRIHS